MAIRHGFAGGQSSSIKLQPQTRKKAHLGKYSIELDRIIDLCGFDSEEAKALGKECFLQVDHPYNLCKVPSEIEDKLERDNRKPLWMGGNVSKSALSGIYTHVRKQYIEKIAPEITTPNNHIMAIIEKAKTTRDVPFLVKLRTTMRTEVDNHREKKAANIQKHKGLSAEEAKKKWSKWNQEYCLDRRGYLEEGCDGEDEKNLLAAILFLPIVNLNKVCLGRLWNSTIPNCR